MSMPEFVRELIRANQESGDDYDRVHATCYFGSKDEIIHTLSCTRGRVNEIRREYEQFREICRTNDSPDWERVDIGPIEDKFFFFADDTLTLDPPILRDKAVPPDTWNAITDEWHALQHIATLGQKSLQVRTEDPFYAEILELWRKRCIPYTEAVAKVAAMKIARRPRGQRYTWQDRID